MEYLIIYNTPIHYVGCKNVYSTNVCGIKFKNNKNSHNNNVMGYIL